MRVIETAHQRSWRKKICRGAGPSAGSCHQIHSTSKRLTATHHHTWFDQWPIFRWPVSRFGWWSRFNEWLTNYIFPAASQNVTEDFVRVGTVCAWSCRKWCGGTTTFCDMYYFKMLGSSRNALEYVRYLAHSTFQHLITQRWRRRLVWRRTPLFAAGKTNTLITPAVALHAPYTVSGGNLRDASRPSDRTGALILIHCWQQNSKSLATVWKKRRIACAVPERIGF